MKLRRLLLVTKSYFGRNRLMREKSLLLTVLAALGVGAVSTTESSTAHASVRYDTVKSINRNNLPYHATTQHSAYIYNVNHTRKLHNLKNYSSTTWYVSKSLLMRSSYTGKENVFYYVTSGNGRVNGIVWRGYLTAGPNPGASSDTNSGDSTSNSNSADNGGTNTGATGNNDSSTNSNSGTNSGLIGSSTTTYSTNSNQFNTKDVTAFNKQIIQLFPGLLEDQKLDDVASQDLELSDKYNYGDQETLLDKYIVQTYGGAPIWPS